MIKFEFNFSNNLIEGGTLVAILLIVIVALIIIILVLQSTSALWGFFYFEKKRYKKNLRASLRNVFDFLPIYAIIRLEVPQGHLWYVEKAMK